VRAARSSREAEDAMKKRAIEIWVRRAEGRASECIELTLKGGDGYAEVWARADSVLQRWSRTAPDSGGYDKCDFRILYEDGETYEGRYDLQRHESVSIATHMLSFLECYSGRKKPGHMKEADYRRLLAYHEKEGHLASYGRFLDEYEVGPTLERRNAQELWAEAMGA
jgi:hypothetical protein